jgi:DNA-binding NtrC family response regulator
MGLTKIEEMPEFAQAKAEIESYKNSVTPEVVDETLDFDPAIPLYELEKRYILKALLHYGGNKTQAAQGLGITIKTLYNKLQ